MARRRGKQVALLFLDLDYFKYINDSLGHAIGDLVLQVVAERLVACVRTTDTVCRRGGDEFVILLPEVADDVLVADWLRKWSGARTFEKIWLPLLKAKLGACYQRTSAAFIWATIQRMYAARRSGMKTEQFGYVTGGYATILDRFAQVLNETGVTVRTNAPVAKIRIAGVCDPGATTFVSLRGHRPRLQKSGQHKSFSPGCLRGCRR